MKALWNRVHVAEYTQAHAYMLKYQMFLAFGRSKRQSQAAFLFRFGQARSVISSKTPEFLGQHITCTRNFDIRTAVLCIKRKIAHLSKPLLFQANLRMLPYEGFVFSDAGQAQSPSSLTYAAVSGETTSLYQSLSMILEYLMFLISGPRAVEMQ